MLCDDDQSTWMDQMARRVINANWKDSQQSQDMLVNLLILPPHLLHRCLVACVPIQRCPRLSTLLDTLPRPLHHALIAAFAMAGPLDIQMTESFLMLLGNTCIPAPGLQDAVIEPPPKSKNTKVCYMIIDAHTCKQLTPDTNHTKNFFGHHSLPVSYIGLASG